MPTRQPLCRSLPSTTAIMFAVLAAVVLGGCSLGPAKLPATRIAYISIKPSPARAALLPQIRAANALIRTAAAAREQVEYIDIFTPMLGDSGEPRPELPDPVPDA